MTFWLSVQDQAGAILLLQCARLGLDTILVEDHDEIGTPVHCGECISDLACQNLGLKLPEHVISKSVKGIRVIFPDGTEKCLSEEGYVLEKHLFEQWIAESAVSEGARLCLSHKITGMQKSFEGKNSQDGSVRAKVISSPYKPR